MSAAGPGGADRKYRILIVDDHPVVRMGFAKILSAEPDLTVCGEAASAAEALSQVEATAPDLVIVDISLQDQSGLELVKRLKARDETLKMLVSSMHDETLFAERALRAGAMGYINKEEASGDMVTAIRQVLAGKVYLSSTMTDRMLQSVAGREEKAAQDEVELLSDRELEIFERIGNGLTTRQIADRLNLSVKTVETHRENIKSKLNLANNNELIRRAVEWTLRRG